MPKVKPNNKELKNHPHFHWIHLIAVFILGSYFVLSKVNLVSALSKNSFVASFWQLYLFGTLFVCLFLFIFSHESFFPFAKDIEKQEMKKEKRYLKKFIHHGKMIAVFIVSIVGGPVFSSLTARLLINGYSSKYLIVTLANIPSTIVTVLVGTGVLRLFS